jgi:hypothetical protein
MVGRGKTVIFKLADVPISGYLAVGVVHESPDNFGNMIATLASRGEKGLFDYILIGT